MTMTDRTRINDEIFLRPVTDKDREFLLGVYAAGRDIELSVIPWDDSMKRTFVEHQLDAQTSHYLSEYPDARHDVIVLADTGEQVGRIYVKRSDDRIAILDITVLHEYRGRGIASAVVGSLTDEASSSGRSVQVYVETFNPSQAFFIKRGFKVEETSGINVKLVWRQPEKS